MKTGVTRGIEVIRTHRTLRAPAMAAVGAVVAAVLVAIAPLPRPLPPLDGLSSAHLSAIPTRMEPVRTHPYCAFVWNLPPIAQFGSLASCDGTLGSRAAAVVVGRYGGRVLGAELTMLTLSVSKGMHIVDDRATWILSVDRYLTDLPGWTDTHHDCSPGRVLVLLDAGNGKPVGELAWGTRAPPSPGDPCPTARG